MASDHEAGPAENYARLAAGRQQPSEIAEISGIAHLRGYAEGLGLDSQAIGRIVFDLKAQEAREINRGLDDQLHYVLSRAAGLAPAKALLRAAGAAPKAD